MAASIGSGWRISRSNQTTHGQSSASGWPLANSPISMERTFRVASYKPMAQHTLAHALIAFAVEQGLGDSASLTEIACLGSHLYIVSFIH
jgi:hypothetical protein